MEYITDKKKKNINEIIMFLENINYDFPIPLTNKVNIREYVHKLYFQGRIICCFDDNKLVGIIGGYINDFQTKNAYISVVGVLNSYRGQSIASNLIKIFSIEASKNSMEYIYLHTHPSNEYAKKMYEKSGFYGELIDQNTLLYIKNIKI
ncbi:GNAT family N-acetyltransferase [Aerococcaceae bacterium zg-ZJ1578]|uniref:GNAT family N-acetyltransferase n=1 Tax=Aerococcaceae bacterium zg-252 TaxID=2796928 RepID=UPI001A2FFB11|nr:GNAT family N-acetyltransferase [Aerococcaceae bacterium zg-1578]